MLWLRRRRADAAIASLGGVVFVEAAALIVSHQVITVHLEHERVIRRVLKDGFDIDIVEYCLADYLLCCKDPLPSTFLHQFNTQKYRTMLSAVALLEDKGIIAKEQANMGRKTFLVRLTTYGEQLAKDASALVFDCMKSTFWRNIPEDEIEHTMRYSTTALENLKAAPLQLYASDFETSKIHPYFFLDIIYIIRRWKEVVAEASGLTLTAYRTLSLLESFGEMSPSDIASTLCVEKSSVSASKEALIERGYVVENEDGSDRRRLFLSCADQGRTAARRLNDLVEKETKKYFSPVDAKTINILNAHHMRMYCEVRRLHAEHDPLAEPW